LLGVVKAADNQAGVSKKTASITVPSEIRAHE
jgi:hypothetical protein